MNEKFKKFKGYIDSLHGIQIENKKAKKTINPKTKEQDLYLLMGIVDHMKLVPVGEEEKELLQYGLFFDGEHLFYDENEVEQLNQKDFNMYMLNHLFHFMLGAHVALPSNATKSNCEKYIHGIALYLAHFNISGVTPKYGLSVRGKWYDLYHVPNKGYGKFIFPRPKTSDYFYDKFEAGKIQLPPGCSIEKVDMFDNEKGRIYDVRVTLPHVNASGVNFSERICKQVIFIKNEDGTFKKHNGRGKASKEIKDAKELLDFLSDGF